MQSKLLWTLVYGIYELYPWIILINKRCVMFCLDLCVRLLFALLLLLIFCIFLFLLLLLLHRILYCSLVHAHNELQTSFYRIILQIFTINVKILNAVQIDSKYENKKETDKRQSECIHIEVLATWKLNEMLWTNPFVKEMNFKLVLT